MATQQSDYRAIDPLLTESVFGAVPSGSNLLSETSVLERVNTEEGRLTGTLWVERRDAFMGTEGDGTPARAPGAPYKEMGDTAPFTETYSVVNQFGRFAMIPKEHRRANQLPYELVERRAVQLERARLLRRERSLASLLQTGANFVRDLDCAGSGAGDFQNVKSQAGGIAWDQAGATPFSDMMLFAELFTEDNGGIRPDTAIVPLRMAGALARSQEFRGYFGDAADGIASGATPLPMPAVRDLIAAALGINSDRVFMPFGRYRTSREGAATLAEDYAFAATTFGLYRLTGGEGMATGAGNIEVAPVAAIELFDPELSGFVRWSDPSGVAEYVAADDFYDHKLIPTASGGTTTTLGAVLTDCIS